MKLFLVSMVSILACAACGSMSDTPTQGATVPNTAAAMAQPPRGACAGVAAACLSLAADACTTQHGCVVRTTALGPTCAGQAKACELVLFPRTCETQRGCFWHAED